MPTRWVGIDEAGYGPNLGPLVMTAVVAESPDDQPPDVWADLAATVDRAGGDPNRLWVDDSKAVHRPGHGRERLDSACLAVLAAADRPRPRTLSGLLAALDAGTLDEAELTRWLDGNDPVWPDASLAADPRVEALQGARWRVCGVWTEVVGPARFNRGLEQTDSKARVHFAAFARLLARVWEQASDGAATSVRGDKHGGRHFYLEPLIDAFPDAWIDRGEEGPDLSRYTLRDRARRLELRLQPRADSADGLVALASLVSKSVRELWMDAFNAYWRARLPDLKPTAGYPVDAARFRRAIEPLCREGGLDLGDWWRAR